MRVYYCEIVHGRSHVSSSSGKLEFIMDLIKRNVEFQGRKLTITVKPAKLPENIAKNPTGSVLNFEYSTARNQRGPRP